MRYYVGCRNINWFKSKLDKIYGNDNNGFVYGLELQKYNSSKKCIWFASRTQRDQHRKQIERGLA